MKVRDIMSSPAVSVGPDEPLSLVAALMREHGIGALPVVENGRLAGIVTDRDLVLAIIDASAGTAISRVRDMMTADVIWCRSDEAILVAAHRMGDHQIRRLPVLNESGALVGMVSLGDIAENVSEQLAGETLGEIVEAR